MAFAADTCYTQRLRTQRSLRNHRDCSQLQASEHIAAQVTAWSLPAAGEENEMASIRYSTLTSQI